VPARSGAGKPLGDLVEGLAGSVDRRPGALKPDSGKATVHSPPQDPCRQGSAR